MGGASPLVMLSLIVFSLDTCCRSIWENSAKVVGLGLDKVESFFPMGRLVSEFCLVVSLVAVFFLVTAFSSLNNSWRSSHAAWRGTLGYMTSTRVHVNASARASVDLCSHYGPRSVEYSFSSPSKTSCC
jgi:hypothetical protein